MTNIRIENNNGSLRMRVQVGGKRYTFTPVPRGRYNDKSVMSQARLVAQRMASDIKQGLFDTSLVSYKTGSPIETTTPHRTVLSLTPPPVVEATYAYSLAELWYKFLAYKLSTGIAHSTYTKDYKSRLNSTLRYLPTLNLEDAIAIRDWIVETKPAAQARRIILRLSECCEWARTSKLIPDNPFADIAKLVSRDIGRTRARKQPDPFTREERDEIIRAFEQSPQHQHYAGFIKFIFYIGCRPSEAIGLRWNSIGNRVIVFCNSYVLNKDTNRLKTERSRTVAIGDRVHNILVEQYKQERSYHDYVFTSRRGEAINWSSFHRNHWTPVLKSLPHIRYRSPYHMRHTFITLMLLSGEGLTDIGKHCGNTPRTILDNYAGVTKDYVPPEI